MATVYKPKRSRKWYIAYKDHTGKRIVVPGCRDKAATKATAQKLERDADRLKAGLSTNKPIPCMEAMEAWLKELKRQGGTDNHNHEARRILGRIIEDCQWKLLTDIRPATFRHYLSAMADKGNSPQTQNNHHAVLRAWLNWCASEMHWLEANPIHGMSMARVGQKGKVHRRRAFTIEELADLCKKAPPHRAAIYKVAAFSGLRRSELARIEKRDIVKAADNLWYWHLRAEATKSARTEILPMIPDCIDAILPIWKDLLSPTSKIFGTVPHITTLHQDLEAAGIKRKDDHGRVLDFHSLRYTFCSLLANVMPIQRVMKFMRHTDIKLTANLYMDLGLMDLNEQQNQLPKFLETKHGIQP